MKHLHSTKSSGRGCRASVAFRGNNFKAGADVAEPEPHHEGPFRRNRIIQAAHASDPGQYADMDKCTSTLAKQRYTFLCS